MPSDSRRSDRLAEAIREEVATFLAEGVKDPRIQGFVTVTAVEVTRYGQDPRLITAEAILVATGSHPQRPKGVEVDGTFHFTEQFSLTGAAAYLDAKYVSYPNGQCLFPPTAANGCNVATGTQDLAGVRLETSGFELDHEISAKLLARGYRIVEVPISYSPRSKAQGKKIGLRDWFIGARTYWRYGRG